MEHQKIKLIDVINYFTNCKFLIIINHKKKPFNIFYTFVNKIQPNEKLFAFFEINIKKQNQKN
jgi:hypothetical protein